MLEHYIIMCVSATLKIFIKVTQHLLRELFPHSEETAKTLPEQFTQEECY